jgi:hypothetical protein
LGAIYAASFGIAFVLAPGFMMSQYGAMEGLLIARLYGAAQIGIAVLDWFARNAKEGKALRAIILANLVSATIGFILALLGQFSGVVNRPGWFVVVIYLLFALIFAYYLFGKPSTS